MNADHAVVCFTILMWMGRHSLELLSYLSSRMRNPQHVNLCRTERLLALKLLLAAVAWGSCCWPLSHGEAVAGRCFMFYMSSAVYIELTGQAPSIIAPFCGDRRA